MGYRIEHTSSHDCLPAYKVLDRGAMVGTLRHVYGNLCFYPQGGGLNPTNLRKIADIIELVEQIEKADSIRTRQESSPCPT